MNLLTEQLKKQLPRFDDYCEVQENTPLGDRKVYAHFFQLPSNFDWFVLAGKQTNDDYWFVCHVSSPMCPEGELGEIPLSYLENWATNVGAPMF